MFRHFASSIFMRREIANPAGATSGKMTRSELQDLFQTEFDMHNRTALEITSRQNNRRQHSVAA